MIRVRTITRPFSLSLVLLYHTSLSLPLSLHRPHLCITHIPCSSHLLLSTTPSYRFNYHSITQRFTPTALVLATLFHTILSLDLLLQRMLSSSLLFLWLAPTRAGPFWGRDSWRGQGTMTLRQRHTEHGEGGQLPVLCRTCSVGGEEGVCSFMVYLFVFKHTHSKTLRLPKWSYEVHSN